jgi:cell volume regulation protein A
VDEPFTLALALAVAGVLLAFCVLLSRASGRFGVPVALAFLAIGMLAGVDGVGGIAFDDYRLAYRIGTVALVVILFDGGLNTSWRATKPVLAPAAVLATIGVVLTAAVTALAAWGLGLQAGAAILLGAVVSSTDAAAVFSTLRTAGIQLRRRVASLIELESGLNDPMAVILTVAATTALTQDEVSFTSAALGALVQLLVGTAAGFGVGHIGRFGLSRVRLASGGLYPALLFAVALFAYGAATAIEGSGFLAVYVAGIVVGGGAVPYRSGVLRVFDAFAWFAQIGMFLVLGLLAYPTRLLDVALPGLIVGLVLAVIARPLAVMLCLLPWKHPRVEKAYVGWMGLRGAVPIVLATYPVLAGARGAETVFDHVVFVVVVACIVPGSTVRWATKLAGLEVSAPPPPPAVLEFVASQPLDGEVLSFGITPAAAVVGAKISEIDFPPHAAVALVVRGSHLIAPRGSTLLEAGDHVFIFCHEEDRSYLELLFGRAEGD